MDFLEHALRYLQAGQAAMAESMASRALAAGLHEASALSLLALARSAQSKPRDALPLYRRLTALQPAVATHWSNLGNCLCELGMEAEAHDPLMRARTLGADDDAVHFALARMYSVLGPAAVGLEHIDLALERAPGDPEYRLLRAKLLYTLDEWEDANAEIRTLMAQPLDQEQRGDIGHLLLHSGFFDAALQLFGELLAADPGHVDAHLGMIMALERVNRVEEAIARRVALEPRLDAANRDRLREKLLQVDAHIAARANRHGEARDLLRQLLSPPPAELALRIALLFELGAALDKTGECDAAMAAFAEAHALRRGIVNENHPALVRGDSLFVALDQPPLQLPPPVAVADGRRDPVFVVGFPRSGTTLLEQLLDAHPELASFDEQPFLQRMVQALCVGGRSLQEGIDGLDAEAVQRLRDQYFGQVAQLLPDLGERRPVDKNPLNLVRLGVIQNILPGTRTILAIRHPCDVVLSCYMQHFRSPVFAVTFETLAACVELYDRVFTHWWQERDRFRLPVHVLRYEDLVADTEAEARRLFGFLGLPWHPQLLGFTERARAKGAISTPSYAQVIEPVNARSVGRWTRYRTHFDDDALATLLPWIRRFGYDDPA